MQEPGFSVQHASAHNNNTGVRQPFFSRAISIYLYLVLTDAWHTYQFLLCTDDKKVLSCYRIVSPDLRLADGRNKGDRRSLDAVKPACMHVLCVVVAAVCAKKRSCYCMHAVLHA